MLQREPLPNRPAPRAVTPRDVHARMFEDLEREHGYEPMRLLEGAVPASLAGTLYGNGPSLRGLFGERYEHWFDGDGAVTAIRFDGGAAEAAVRLVDTDGLRDERARGRMLYAGYHRPPARRLLLRPPLRRAKNTANTSVMHMDGRLFALWEGGLPTELDPLTLETWGTTRLGEIGSSFTAHPRPTPSGRVIGYGVRGLPSPAVDLYELSDDGASRLARVPLPFMTTLHDFAVTDRYAIFFVSPLRLRRLRALLGLGGLDTNLEWAPELGTEVLIVPLNGDPVTRFATEAFHQWHFARAVEHTGPGGTELRIDFVRYPDFASNEHLARIYRGEPAAPGSQPGSLWRATLDPARQRASFEPLDDQPCEFPRALGEVTFCAAHADERAYQDARSTQHVLRHENGRTQSVEVGGYVGEPVPVRTPDGNFLLVDAYVPEDGRMDLVVLDEHLNTRARLAWPSHVPPRFHHAFVRR